ncbi:MAG: glycosyltransferase [Sedimentisphaerales bacterium]|jgi:glycosyltransferase involved in cell wall biosynthesis
MARSALFISTLNEINGITQLFPLIPISQFDECYALDGGSQDGTIEFFKENGVEVVHNVKKGEIFNVGAETTECENLVFFAPDGNEDPNDIIPLLKKIEEGNDMAIGSRFMKGSRNEEDDKLIPFRAWANKAFTILVRLLWGGNITDSINGFRSIRRIKLLEMNLEPTGFDIEFQMTIRGLKLGHKIVEIPTKEGDRIGGQSTAYSMPTGILMLRRLTREVFNGTRFGNQAKTAL